LGLQDSRESTEVQGMSYCPGFTYHNDNSSDNNAAAHNDNSSDNNHSSNSNTATHHDSPLCNRPLLASLHSRSQKHLCPKWENLWRKRRNELGLCGGRGPASLQGVSCCHSCTSSNHYDSSFGNNSAATDHDSSSNNNATTDHDSSTNNNATTDHDSSTNNNATTHHDSPSNNNATTDHDSPSNDYTSTHHDSPSNDYTSTDHDSPYSRL